MGVFERLLIIYMLCFGFSQSSSLPPLRPFVSKDQGICQVDFTIYNLSDIRGCEEIISSLHIGSTASNEQNIEPTITYVEGCVTIKETELMDLNFLKNLEMIECKEKGGNVIKDNPILCLSEEEKENLTKLFDEVDSAYNICPVCKNKTFTDDCKTFFGDFYVNENTSISKLREILGRLVISNINNPELLMRSDKLLVLCTDCKQVAVEISNIIPPDSFFDHIAIVSDSVSPLLTIDVYGYKMSRSLHAMLSDKLRNKFSAPFEKDGECHLYDNASLNSYTDQDLMDCEHISGLLQFDSANVLTMKHKWKQITTIHSNISFSGDSSMKSIFAQKVTLNFEHPGFRLVIKFVGKLCLDADVYYLARKWFEPRDQFRVIIEAEPTCHTYKGTITDYDLRKDDGSRMVNVEGMLRLRDLTSAVVLQKLQDDLLSPLSDREVWNIDFSRFSKIKEIKKSMFAPADEPALSLTMCGNKIKIPEFFINKIDYSSHREDDILIRITGPAFKMEAKEYTILKKKVGASRLDINEMLPGECTFWGPIKDLTQLNGCESIVGDLVLNSFTTGETTTIIKRVSGCIHVQNTSLTNLDFLQFESDYDISACHQCFGTNGFEISDNPDLCISHTVFPVDKKYVSRNKPGCGNDLKEGEYVESIVVIDEDSDNQTINSFKIIKELRGRIIVHGTNLTKLDCFKKLEKIVYLGKGPAILIMNSPNLTGMEFPALKIIRCSHMPPVFIKNVPHIDIDIKLEETFKKAAGKDAIREENDPVEEEEKEIWKGIGYGFGIAFGCVMAVATVIITAVVAVTVGKHMRKKATQKVSTKNAVGCHTKKGAAFSDNHGTKNERHVNKDRAVNQAEENVE